MNYYSWLKEIHKVRTMRIIFYTKRVINGTLGRPKNLLPFKVHNIIKEGRSKHVISLNKL
jgi:hypothetical protein